MLIEGRCPLCYNIQINNTIHKKQQRGWNNKKYMIKICTKQKKKKLVLSKETKKRT